jgi:aminomethyltransferase
VPRSHYAVKDGQTVVGTVTSGTMSPTLGQAVGTAMVDIADAKKDTEFAIEIRHKTVKARVVPPPFVPHRVKR